MNGPAWPDAQPWENYVFAIAAVAIVLVNREAMLTRDQAVTEVLYPGEEPAQTIPMDPPPPRRDRGLQASRLCPGPDSAPSPEPLR